MQTYRISYYNEVPINHSLFFSRLSLHAPLPTRQHDRMPQQKSSTFLPPRHLLLKIMVHLHRKFKQLENVSGHTLSEQWCCLIILPSTGLNLVTSTVSAVTKRSYAHSLLGSRQPVALHRRYLTKRAKAAPAKSNYPDPSHHLYRYYQNLRSDRPQNTPHIQCSPRR